MFRNTIYKEQANKRILLRKLRRNRQVKEESKNCILFDKRERNARTGLSTTVATLFKYKLLRIK